jgi:hypothetical protein
MNKTCNHELSHPESLAWEIYKSVDNFQRTYKGFESLDLDKEILSDLNFGIINDFYNKNVLISYVLKPDTNVIEVELHLMFLGINKEFVDKSIRGKKRYLAVWI